MALRLYNTRTRSVENFTPLAAPKVRIYVCGLTPSAQAHLGHARSFLFFDVLRRYLRHLGYEVTYVQNVTDIDDRSINRARETGEDWYEIVSGYYATFKRSMQRLGVREPDEEPYATKFIPQIIAMIEQLEQKGYAYVSKDGVYYRVSQFSRYGELSNRNIEELESGARIEVDEAKEDPLDFALWKFAKPGEPKWLSPWGDGRPGWHIECSAMSHELLDARGEGFDIHGGGADLIFPHHENEIAQSEPLMPHPPMANFWMHGGLLLFDNQKMSKSLGNFEPLYELLDRHDPQAIRLLFLQTGYRKVMNFTEESISAAAVALERLKKTYRAAGSGASGDLPARMELALDDDMNTAVALSELLSYRGDSREEFAYWLDILGLTPGDAWLEEPLRALPADFLERLRERGAPANGATPEEAVEEIVAARTQARKEKNWAESDRLRDLLAQCGVALKDSKDGTTWTVAE
ncbi:MAG TPA: cysteine--tRNA ligase [Candidatus Baltobacteraceae bacterium]|nr:cysteine--tRNA ligase [Candidatus Baltobacteraceae bacterium]